MRPDADTLTAYALGLLDEAEERQVREYLEANPDVARQVRADQDALAAMALSLPPGPVPPGSEDRLMARIQSERREAPAPGVPVAPPPARRPVVRWWWPAGIAAAVALVVALGYPALQDWQTQRLLSAYRDQPGAVTRELRGAGGEALGTLVRLPDDQVFVLLRERAQENRVYQAWVVEGEGPPRSLGVFEDRRILTRPLPDGAAFAVSVEPSPEGSPQPTSTPIVVVPLPES